MKYKVVVFVPVDSADAIRKVLGDLGAGKVGNYDFVSFSTRGTGRFRPLEGANPAIGNIGKLAEVEEERIEVIISSEKLNEVLEAVRKAHPYEEPAIDVYEVKDI